jgi:chorismate mutase-like protein
MDIADWRKKIDEIDQRLVAILNERAAAAQQIGFLKRDANAPVYEPARERQIFEHVRSANRGPLPDRDLLQLYERIIDVMRKLQRAQMNEQPTAAVSTTGTEIEADTNE